MEKRKLSWTVDENVNWCNHYKTQPPKLKIQLILKQEGLNCANPFIYNFSIGGSHSTAQTDSVSKSLLCSEVTSRTTIQSSNSILEYPKKTKTLIQKDKCTSMFIPALFTIAKIWKQPMCPSIEEIKKLWHMYHICTYICTHKGAHTLEYYYLTIKKMKSSHLWWHG